MRFQIPGNYLLDRIIPKSVRALQFAELFGLASDCASRHVVTIAEGGERIGSGDFEVLYADHCGLIVAGDTCDATYADSLEDTVERYLGLASKTMATPHTTFLSE